MKIMISGMSGFVGNHLNDYFTKAGHDVYKIPRNYILSNEKLIELLLDSDVVINLSGANIIHRWSESYKKSLYSSRIDTTKAIVNAINNLDKKPILISTSAVGIYANKGIHSEDKYEYGNGFLSKLCRSWEEEASKAKTKVVIFRFGIVLGNGGALKKMLLPFKLGVGGVIADGKQLFPFIHIEDLLRAFEYVIKEKELQGVFNLCAPVVTTNMGLTKALGRALNRPTILPVPKFVLRLIYGEGSKVLTDGQNVVPEKLISSGFKFHYEDINSTIDNLILKN